jgi:maleylpyruvate isomerase
VDARLLDRQLAGLAVSHRGLVAMLTELDARGELDPAAASLLPGWTVGHVLTHLARNADSVTRVLEASERGDVVERYPGGCRDADIEAGHARPAAQQVADVRESIDRLEVALTVHTRWDGQSIEANGHVMAVGDLVLARWREVEVHRADLGLGYGPADWPAAYVRSDLVPMEMRWNARRPMGLTGLPAPALAQPDHIRLAWLLGRGDIDGVGPANVM